jgi:hypothetical protein
MVIAGLVPAPHGHSLSYLTNTVFMGSRDERGNDGERESRFRSERLACKHREMLDDWPKRERGEIF